MCDYRAMRIMSHGNLSPCFLESHCVNSSLLIWRKWFAIRMSKESFQAKCAVSTAHICGGLDFISLDSAIVILSPVCHTACKASAATFHSPEHSEFLCPTEIMIWQIEFREQEEERDLCQGTYLTSRETKYRILHEKHWQICVVCWSPEPHQADAAPL